MSRLRPDLRPPDLGDGAWDDRAVEAGVLLHGRFCVLSTPERQRDGEMLLVSDLDRALGPPPHHRLVLHVLATSPAANPSIRAAVTCDGQVQPACAATMGHRRGLAVLAAERAGEPIGDQKMEPEGAAQLGRTLVGLLVRIHHAGFAGVRFRGDQILIRGRGYALSGYGHLVGGGDVCQDVTSLFAFLVARGLTADLADPTQLKDARDLAAQLGVGDGEPGWVLPAEPPFSGRLDELTAALSALKEARLAQPSVLVFHGPEGAGKTRLLQQLCLDFRRGGGALVLEPDVATSDVIGAPPASGTLGPFLDALPGAIDQLPRLEAEAVRRRMLAAAGPLSGVIRRASERLGRWLGTAESAPEVRRGEELARHGAVIAAALAAVGTQRRPLVIPLDDVDRADEGTRAALASLFADGPSHHTLILTSASAPAAAVVPGARVVPIRPFTDADIAALLTQALAGPVEELPAMAERLVSVSGGNPLTLWATLERWVGGGRISRVGADNSWSLQPDGRNADGVPGILSHRLERLSTDARWILLLASIGPSGAPVMPAWLAAAAGWPAGRVEGAVSELASRGLLRADSRGALSVAHRSAVEWLKAHCSPTELRNAHGQLAELYGRQGDRIRLAFHREHHRSPGQDQELADLHLQAAEVQLAVFAVDLAKWHACRAMERAARDETRARAHGHCAEATVLAGDLAQAGQEYAEAVRVSPGPLLAVEIATQATYGLFRRSGFAQIEAVAGQALVRGGEASPWRRLGPVWSLLRALALLVLPLRWPRDPALRDALCRFYTYLGGAFSTTPPIMMLAVSRGVALARGLSSGAAAICVAFQAGVFAMLGRAERARGTFARAEAMADAAGDPHALGIVHHFWAHMLSFAAESYRAGQERLDRAIDAFERSGDLSIGAVSWFLKAHYGYGREPAKRLFAWLRHAEAAAERHHNSLIGHPIAALRSLLRLQRGDEGALEQVILCADGLAGNVVGLSPPDEVASRINLGRAFALAGMHDEARHQVKLALACLGRGPVIEPLYDLFVVGIESCLDDAPESRKLRRALARQLRTAARRSRRMRPAAQLAWARSDAARGRVTQAVDGAAQAAVDGVAQGDLLTSRDAHRLLSGLRAGSDVVAAAEHRREAARLTARLGFDHPEEAAGPPSASPGQGSDGASDLEQAMSALRLELASALGSAASLAVELVGDVATLAPDPGLLSLVTRSVLLARDVGAHGVIRVTIAAELERGGSPTLDLSFQRGAHGLDLAQATPPLRRGASELGLTLEHGEEQGVCWLRLRPARRHAPRLAVAIIHGDPRVRSTLSQTLERLGAECTVADHVRELPVGCRYLFVESGLDPDSLSLPSEICVVKVATRVPRRAAQSGVLAVPCSLDELERVLTDGSTGSPSA